MAIEKVSDFGLVQVGSDPHDVFWVDNDSVIVAVSRLLVGNVAERSPDTLEDVAILAYADVPMEVTELFVIPQLIDMA